MWTGFLVGALVLGLGAGHGRVGAQLGTEALRLCVVDPPFIQLDEAAAATAGEVVRAGASTRC